MSILKRAAAGAVAACLCLTLAACKDTSWVYKIDGVEITSGMYLTFLVNGKQEASQKVEDTSKDLWSQKIENKDAQEWVKDYAKKMSLQYAAVEKEFDRLGLKLTDEDKEQINSNVETYWASTSNYYEPNGAGKASFAKVMENSYKSSLLFDKYYDKGGIQEVSDTELMKYYKENYAHVKAVVLPLQNTTTGASLSDEQKKELKTKAEKYLDRIKKGEDIDKIIAEYKEESTTSASSSGTSSTTSGGSSSASGASSAAGSNASSSASGASSASTSSSSIDPNIMQVEKDNTSYPEKFTTAVFNAKAGGDPVFVEDTSYYAVLQRFDVEEDKEIFDQSRKSVLFTYKTEDFQGLIDGWGKELKVETNEASVSRYKPKKVADPKVSSTAAY